MIFMVVLETEESKHLYFCPFLSFLDCQSIEGDDSICTVYLLFPVEAASVAVGDVDVTVGLENGALEATQHSVEQLPARSLGRK